MIRNGSGAGMGSIYRRGTKRGQNKKAARGPYIIAWVDTRGRQHAKSTRIKGKPGTGYDLNAARRELAILEGEAAKGSPVTARTGQLPFIDALQDVIRDQQVNGRRALDSTERRIKLHLAPFFDGYRLADMTATELRRYIASRKSANAQPATINRELAIIRRALRLAYRAGHILTVPHVELLDESRNVRQGIIEPHDFAKVLAALRPEAYAAAAETAFVTGWRLRSEVLTLTWAQVDTTAGLIRIDPGVTKAGEGRTFPLTARLRTIITARKRARATDSMLVFHDGAGQAIKPKHFYKAWKPACDAANVQGLIPHDLRRSAVREMERRQIPRQVSMKLVGHKTESIFRRYAIVSEADLRAAGQRLDAPPAAVRTAEVLHSRQRQSRRRTQTRRNASK